MKYSDDSAINAVYTLVAQLSERDHPEQARLDEAMVISAALENSGRIVLGPVSGGRTALSTMS